MLISSLFLISSCFNIKFWQQKGIPKNCRNAKISGRCPIFPKPNASHFYSVKRSSVFYAKIGPRLSPKLFAMRDFLTACELCSGIIPRFPERLFAVRDSLRRVDCSRGLSAATLPRKIVCRAGFPDGVWITVGDYRPPRSPERLFAMRDFLTACELYLGIIGRHAPPKIVCRAGFPHGVWIVFRDYRPRKKITPKNVIFTTRAGRKRLFHPRRCGGSHTE